MSCHVDMSLVSNSYFTQEQKTFYSILFKDGYSAYVTQETLSDIINSRLSSIENVVKYNYDNNLEYHVELMLYSDIIGSSGDDYIKIYENLPQMYGTNPLTEFDRKLIRMLSK